MSCSIGSCSHFVVRFLLDECISTVLAKQIISPAPSSVSVGKRCTVKWTDGDYEAIVLATGTFTLLLAYMHILKAYINCQFTSAHSATSTAEAEKAFSLSENEDSHLAENKRHSSSDDTAPPQKKGKVGMFSRYNTIFSCSVLVYIVYTVTFTRG